MLIYIVWETPDKVDKAYGFELIVAMALKRDKQNYKRSSLPSGNDWQFAIEAMAQSK